MRELKKWNRIGHPSPRSSFGSSLRDDRVAMYVLDGFLKFLGVFSFYDNVLCQTSNYRPQVLWTMAKKHEKTCTPARMGYLRN